MNLKISTITITTESNINYDLESIINMDFSEHKYLKQNTLLKNKDYKLFLKTKFEYGTILCIKYKDKFNGYKLNKKNKKIKKLNDFINQISIDIISKNNLKISAMVFGNGRIKLAGCRSIDDVLVILEIDKCFKNYKKIIVNNSSRFTTLSPFTEKSFHDQHIILVFQNMINATHYFDFEINKKILNRIINKLELPNFNCSYEPTGQQCVKLEIKNTSNKIYHVIKILNKSLDSELHPAGPEEILRLGEAPRGQSPSLHPSIPLSGISNNFIMINSKFKVNDYFKQIISNAKIEPIYFNESKDDLDKINCLIEKQTNGKIVDVIQDIKETAFMIFNIIYFEFEWEHEFNENDTKLKNFTNYLKNTTEKKFMEMKNNYIDYRKQNEIEMISLNFNKSDLKMIFIKSTNLQKISNLTFDFIKMSVFISIPKFKIASEFDLLKSLTDMGISLRDKYCLDKFGDNLKIDKFIQKTFIDVSERKVEAASVTLFKPNFRSADYKKRINFILDEPYTFIIKDDKNIFFIGKYIE